MDVFGTRSAPSSLLFEFCLRLLPCCFLSFDRQSHKWRLPPSWVAMLRRNLDGKQDQSDRWKEPVSRAGGANRYCIASCVYHIVFLDSWLQSPIITRSEWRVLACVKMTFHLMSWSRLIWRPSTSNYLLEKPFTNATKVILFRWFYEFGQSLLQGFWEYANIILLCIGDTRTWLWCFTAMTRFTVE